MEKAKVIEMFAAANNAGRVAHFKKFGTITARPAVADEVIETVIDGKTETTNTANAGDFVVTNPGGEQYIVPGNKFAARYELLEGNTYIAKGECWGFEHVGEGFTFVAPWGEDMVVENGDFIVVSGLDSLEDIYRIERQAFFDTYKAA